MLCLAHGRGLHRSIFSRANTSSLCQEHVVKEELLNALYCEFINRVNEVGVDVNRAIAHPHSQALLQYVCGLGPRKGTHLLKVRRLLSLPTKPAHHQHSVSAWEVSQGSLCQVQLTALLMCVFYLAVPCPEATRGLVSLRDPNSSADPSIPASSQTHRNGCAVRASRHLHSVENTRQKAKPFHESWSRDDVESSSFTQC